MSEVTLDTMSFAARLALAQPGELIPYHTGQSLRGCRDAKEALAAHHRGEAELIQRRLMPGRSLFVYLALKRRRNEEVL